MWESNGRLDSGACEKVTNQESQEGLTWGKNKNQMHSDPSLNAAGTIPKLAVA